MLKAKAGIFFMLLLTAPGAAFALALPQNGSQLAEMSGINAQAYVAQNVETGEVLISKNADSVRVPASLTKLVTALVVLDSKVKLTKSVAMTAQDRLAGGCNVGGVCIKSAPGVKFTVDGLFHATLILSANNAANALARSTGLSPAVFAERMNQKALSLGAVNSHFNEPTGMDPENKITANDYIKIVSAAFDNAYLRKVAGMQSFLLRSANNSRYNQTIKNKDKLLGDSEIELLGAKTGYLTESQYNFAAVLKYRGGQKLAVVVLGEPHLYTAYDETKKLADLAEQTKYLAALNMPAVLGSSTVASLLNVYN